MASFRAVAETLQQPDLDRVQTLLGRLADAGAESRARAELTEVHLALVLETAESLASETVPAEDLFQEGSGALVTLVHGLDPERPPTATELQRQIREVAGRVMGALLREDEEARRQDRRWAADAERLFQAQAELRLRDGHDPSDLELARHLSWNEGRVSQLRRAVAEATSQADDELRDILGELDSD